MKPASVIRDSAALAWVPTKAPAISTVAARRRGAEFEADMSVFLSGWSLNTGRSGIACAAQINCPLSNDFILKVELQIAHVGSLRTSNIEFITLNT
jgi:hypothetical protein